jgi:hypothetical protein
VVGPSHPDVRRVVYESSPEVMGLFNNSKPMDLRPDVPIFVPKPRVEEIEDAEPEQEIKELEVDNTDIVGASISVESIIVTAPNLPH